MLAAGTLSDWLQAGGLTVNALLFLGLLLQIRLATSARREDNHSSKQRATLDAWERLVLSIRDTELASRIYFGRGFIEQAQAAEFLRLVKEASRRRAQREAEHELSDAEILQANEGMRALLNSAEDFAVAVELNAFDRDTVYRVAGWRLSRLVQRHYGYIQCIRESIENPDIYATVERLTDQFMALNGTKREDLRMLAGHDGI